MKRRVLNLFTLASVLLCVTACVLWVRSRTTSEAFLWRAGPVEGDEGDFTQYRAYAVGWSHGLATVGCDNPRRHALERTRWVGRLHLQSGPVRRHPLAFEDGPLKRLGFGLAHVPGREWHLTFPLWLAAALSALLPAARVARWLVRRRARSTGLCPRCGYDLRATPGRCPECGHAAGENR